LTPAGEFLANHVLRAHALLAQASRGIGEFRERVTGALTIVASGVPATYDYSVTWSARSSKV
jgi:hypothetical protein